MRYFFWRVYFLQYILKTLELCTSIYSITKSYGGYISCIGPYWSCCAISINRRYNTFLFSVMKIHEEIIQCFPTSFPLYRFTCMFVNTVDLVTCVTCTGQAVKHLSYFNVFMITIVLPPQNTASVVFL